MGKVLLGWGGPFIYLVLSAIFLLSLIEVASANPGYDFSITFFDVERTTDRTYKQGETVGIFIQLKNTGDVTIEPYRLQGKVIITTPSGKTIQTGPGWNTMTMAPGSTAVISPDVYWPVPSNTETGWYSINAVIDSKDISLTRVAAKSNAFQITAQQIQNQKPSASISGPISSATLSKGQSQTFAVRCTDADGNLRGVDWYLNGQYQTHGSPYPISGSSSTNSWSYTFNAVGTYTVEAQCWDDANGDGKEDLYSTAVAWSVTVIPPSTPTPAPNTASSASRYDPSGSSISFGAGQSKTFTVRCTDNEGNLRGVDWYLNGQYKSHGSPYPISGSSATNGWSNTFSSAGTYTVEAQCWDDANGDGKEDLYSTAVAWSVSINQQTTEEIRLSELEITSPGKTGMATTVYVYFTSTYSDSRTISYNTNIIHPDGMVEQRSMRAYIEADTQTKNSWDLIPDEAGTWAVEVSYGGMKLSESFKISGERKVEQYPDITVSDITISPSSPTEDQTVSIAWTTKNDGAKDVSDRFYTEMYIDGSLAQTWHTDGLSAGRTTWGEYKTALSAGSHTVKVVTDTTGIAPESNNNNNERSAQIYVKSKASNTQPPATTAPSLIPTASPLPAYIPKPQSEFIVDHVNFEAYLLGFPYGNTIECKLNYINNFSEDILIVFRFKDPIGNTVVLSETTVSAKSSGTVKVRTKPSSFSSDNLYVGWEAYRYNDVGKTTPIDQSRSNEQKIFPAIHGSTPITHKIYSYLKWSEEYFVREFNLKSYRYYVDPGVSNILSIRYTQDVYAITLKGYLPIPTNTVQHFYIFMPDALNVQNLSHRSIGGSEIKFLKTKASTHDSQQGNWYEFEIKADTHLLFLYNWDAEFIFVFKNPPRGVYSVFARSSTLSELVTDEVLDEAIAKFYEHLVRQVIGGKTLSANDLAEFVPKFLMDYWAANQIIVLDASKNA